LESAGRVRFVTAGADAAVVPLGAAADPAGFVAAAAAAAVGAVVDATVAAPLAVVGAPPVVAWAFGVSVAVLLPPQAASSSGTAMQSAASSPRGRGTGERNVVRMLYSSYSTTANDRWVRREYSTLWTDR
jgi:hypothetical protein